MHQPSTLSPASNASPSRRAGAFEAPSTLGAPTTPARFEAPAFLRATAWCDADHPVIVHLARELTRGLRTPEAKAVALFNWVRDEVLYTLGDWNWKASETLALRRGTCSNKANLLVALARAAGIPAGFQVMKIRTRHYFGAWLVPMGRRLIREESVHVYATLFLGGRWVKCDATDDKALCESIEGLLPHARLVEFDGVEDATHGFAPEAVIADEGPLPSVDDRLERRASFSQAARRMFGHYIRFMRAQGGRYSKAEPAVQERIEGEFLAWVFEGYPHDCEEFMAEVGAAAAA